MALYSGLSPQDALAKWYAIRQKAKLDPTTGQWDHSALTPEENADVAGNMTGLQQQNPQAFQVVATGMNDNGQNRQVFNPSTGLWDMQQDKGFFSNPESWLQLGFGAGLGGLAAAPALAGGAATSPAAATPTVAGATPAVAGGATIADPGILAGGVPASIASGAGPAAATNLGTGALETVGAAAPAAASGGGSLWKALAGPLIGAGTGIVGSLIQSNQQSKATDAQIKANEEALQFLKDKYAKTQSQVSPYIASGQGALAALDTGLGIKLPQGTSINPQGGFVTQPFQSPSGSTVVPITAPATGANNGQTVTGTLPSGYQPPTSAPMSLAQFASQNTASSVRPAQVGETRMINGQQATWDGHGWSV